MIAFSTQGEGRYLLTGPMVFDTVVQWLDQGKQRLQGRVEFDLGAVSAADSAALALLVEWLRLAGEAGSQLQFRNVPAQLLAIAQVSDLAERLPLVGSDV